jgi:hypothetical protein
MPKHFNEIELHTLFNGIGNLSSMLHYISLVSALKPYHQRNSVNGQQPGGSYCFLNNVHLTIFTPATTDSEAISAHSPGFYSVDQTTQSSCPKTVSSQQLAPESAALMHRVSSHTAMIKFAHGKNQPLFDHIFNLRQDGERHPCLP